MGSFSIALTGLRADSTALNTIGNNLANLNTTAFKDQTAQFSDLFYQQVGSSGSNDPLQQGLGTRVSAISSDFSQGSISTTDSATDLAIQGNGFFVVNDGGQQELTRAGDFQLSPNGELQTNDGNPVLGYQAVNGAGSTGGALGTLTLPIGETQAAQATSNFSLSTNLNSSAATGTSFSSALTVYDSLGTSHVATVTFTKTGSNQWGYAVALPSGDATGSSNTTGTLTFDSDGNLTAPSSNPGNISFTGLSDGASNLSLNWNMFSGTGSSNISQTSATSAVSATSQDGYASGSYSGFTIASDGTISAQFSNGQTQTVGTLALANVANVEGLSRSGDNNYVTTQASGQATIGAAGTGGRGTLEDDALEGSNVDISTEFSNLIVAQRAFEANSKTVTTFDTLTQDVIDMIR
jgi:flagellar hook protein FlgE